MNSSPTAAEATAESSGYSFAGPCCTAQDFARYREFELSSQVATAA